jgi:hypothetical protein
MKKLVVLFAAVILAGILFSCDSALPEEETQIDTGLILHEEEILPVKNADGRLNKTRFNSEMQQWLDAGIDNYFIIVRVHKYGLTYLASFTVKNGEVISSENLLPHYRIRDEWSDAEYYSQLDTYANHSSIGWLARTYTDWEVAEIFTRIGNTNVPSVNLFGGFDTITNLFNRIAADYEEGEAAVAIPAKNGFQFKVNIVYDGKYHFPHKFEFLYIRNPYVIYETQPGGKKEPIVIEQVAQSPYKEVDILYFKPLDD